MYMLVMSLPGGLFASGYTQYNYCRSRRHYLPSVSAIVGNSVYVLSWGLFVCPATPSVTTPGMDMTVIELPNQRKQPTSN